MPGQDVKCVYVLHGPDEFLHAEHRKQLVSQIIGDADPQTAVSSFDASAELAQVLDELRTLPFLAPHRVVLVTSADAFVSAHRQQLESYLNSPSSHSTLILSVTTWPKTTRLYKLVNRIGQAIECSPPQRRGMTEWIAGSAAKRGKQITPEAVQLLLEWIADDVGAMEGEIEKLSLYSGDRERMDAEDVVAVVTATAGPEAFALTNAITTGDVPAAIKALAGSVTRRGEEFRTLGLIAWHLRKAMQVHQDIARGTPPPQACSAVRVYRRQREFLGMLARRPLSTLQNDFRKLLAADLTMKTGGEPRAALQDLVVSLCS